MTLYLYDTAARDLREFHPIRHGQVTVYLCGATVQDVPHLGHVRSSIAFDVLRRWLSHQGNDVIFVRNVTDIDDKILGKAHEAGRPWWEWAATHERAFTEAYRSLGILPPSAEPHATGFVPQMIAYMQRLIDRDHAYAADGNVYFDVKSLPSYGSLSGHKLEDVYQGESLGTGKRDARDFTLWKAAKPGEPSWDTPWGPGRPGWHLECSAMSTEMLGSEFDIHCGGMDLIFPHHENEIAQCVGAGDNFARYWLHNGWVTMSGEKMSKSLGNVVAIPEILRKVRPVELRYYLVSAHYRSMLEYSDGALQEAASAYRRIESFVRRVDARCRLVPMGVVKTEFTNALDDDLGVPAALAVIHTIVRLGNVALEKGDTSEAIEAASYVRAMCDILGVDPMAENWDDGHNNLAAMNTIDVLVRDYIDRRVKARAEKDWKAADDIRYRLSAAGIELTDTPDGVKWSLKADGSSYFGKLKEDV